jgi:hypothetical protein
MPRVKGLNRHQERFLAILRRHPDGLPREQWPRDDALQRWLRQPAFVEQLERQREVGDYMQRRQLLVAARLAGQRLPTAHPEPAAVRAVMRRAARAPRG